MKSRGVKLSLTIALSLVLLLLLIVPVFAQSAQSVAAVTAPQPPLAVEAANTYVFSYTTTTYTEISGTTSTATGDDGTELLTLPFTFKYDGVNYTQGRISTNGYFQLGTGATSSPWTNDLASTTNKPFLAPLWDDLYDDATSVISYTTQGSAPNRILVIQWKGIRWYGSGGTAQNFQIKLYETSNVIEFVYGAMTAPAGSPSASIGINDATGGSGHYLSVTPANPPTVNSTTTNNTIAAVTFLPSGTLYRFTPPPPAPDYSTSTKTVSPSGTRFSGEVLTYTIGVANTGDLTGTATTMSDPIPAGTAYVPGSAQLQGTGTLTGTSTSVDWTGSLGLNEHITVTFQVTLAAQTGSVTNTVTITDPTALFAVSKSVNTAIQIPNYSTSTKTVSPSGTRFTGEVLTYTVAIINSGVMTGTASLSDPVPAGTTYLPSSAQVVGGGTLSDAGNIIAWNGTVSATNRVTVTFNAILTAINSSVTNTATISDPLISAAVVKSASTVVAVPNYSTSTKTSVPATGGLVSTGELITYTVTVINSGQVTGSASLVDFAPAGTAYITGSAGVLGGGTLIENNGISWTGSISVGGRITATFTAAVTALNGVITNTATISDPITLAPVAKSTNHTVRSPIFNTSTKTASAAAAMPGDTLTYTLRIVNSGALSATNATVTDVLPPEFIPNLNGILASSGTVVTATAPTISWYGVVTNSATIVITIPGTINPTVCGVSFINSAVIADPLAASYVVSAPTYVYGPNVKFSESFESVTFPPTGWASTVVTTGATAPVWSRATTGSSPTASPFDGTALATFNSFNASTGSSNRLSGPAINLVTNTQPALVFAMYHDPAYPTTPYDRIQVQVSTDGGSNWNNVGAAIDRYASVSGWTTHAVDLSAYAGQSINFGFLAISQFGNNIHLDAVSVRTCCEPPAGASFTIDPASPLAGGAITFNATVLTGTAPFTYTWNFGDGSALGSGNPVMHTYAVTGTFNVTLTVDCKCGAAVVTQPVTVSDAATPPSLSPLQSSSPTTLGNATYFTSTLLAGSAPITYTWDFGDGAVLVDGLTTSHTYGGVGTYTTILTATNAAGEAVVTTTVDVGIAPTASFAATNPTYFPATTVFTYTGNAGTPPTTFLWAFGDGVTSTLQSPSHVYAAPQMSNLYTATLSVRNAYGTAVTNTVITVLNTSADLGIAKTASPDPVAAGTPLTYTLVVSNFGPNLLVGSPLNSVSFTNTAYITINDNSAATPYPSTINVSGITDIVGKVRVTLYGISHTYPSDIDILMVGPTGQSVILMSDADSGTDISNVVLTFDDNAPDSLPSSAAITSGTFKPTNYGSGDTFPAPAPAGSYGAALAGFIGANPNGAWNLYVVDDAGTDYGAITGGWSLDFTTVMPVTTTVTDVLPAGYTFGGATGNGWTCANNSGTVTCTRGAFPIGAAPNIVITGNAPSLSASGNVTNTATVSSGLPDGNPLNNTAVITTFVNALQSDLSVAKTGMPSVTALGSTVTYWITVTNGGPDATSGVKFVDTLPAAFTFASASGSCANNAHVVTCTLGTLNSGASASASIVVTATAYGTFTNTVAASGDNPDSTPGNNTAIATTSIVWPEISVNPGSFSAVLAPNKATTQTLTISNVGVVPLSWLISEYTTALFRSAYVPAPEPAPRDVNDADRIETIVTEAEKLYTADPGSAPITPFVPEAVLYNNGSFVNLPGGGAGGADASVLQSAIGLGTYGWGHAVSSGFRVADDFVVPGPMGWNINNITFFAYQTGSTLTSTMNAVNYRIWNGVPGAPGSQVIFGDTSTNRLTSTAWSGAYRVLDTALNGTTRPIMADTASAGVLLPPGHYWLDWQTGGSLTSGPWAIPLTIGGVTTTGNAVQYDPAAGTWNPVTDTLASQTQGFPFIIQGTQSAPCTGNIPWVNASPISGATNAGNSSAVNVTFDSTGLAAGVYTGTLCLTSDDADTPMIQIPVSLNVKLYSTYLPLIRK